MIEQVRVTHPIYNLLPAEIDGFETLAELALDLRWSWNHASDQVWRELDKELWEFTHNPWVVLQTVSRDKIERVLANPDFRRNLDALVAAGRQASTSPAWFQKNHPNAPLTCVAYFSMEYMLSEALPIYSGGLGNVAGDQLKAASDLGVPLVAIGLLYQRGYFRQAIDTDGNQQALYPFNDPGQLPITPLRQENGEWLRLEVALPGYSVWLRAWQVQVGRVKLYLLDSNDAANFPVHRGITSELYGGGSEVRLKQEMLLGIGGWRLLRALGLKPEVCHLNEGHAALAVLERARTFMEETGQQFDVALAVTRAGNLFTTHTAVAAGFDLFNPELMQQYLGGYAEKLGIPFRDLLALGRRDPDNDAENFNMAYLALRGSGSVNGVSRLHGQVSRRIFQPLFPRWPEDEVPVGHVTNGVHMPTWDSAEADELWTSSCGKDRWLGSTETLEHNIRQISDASVWSFRTAAANCLVEFARARLSRQLSASGGSNAEVDEAKNLFDPNVLTLGFARRFATYKRPNLLLNDPARLLGILSNAQRPVQLIIAGKAHPADEQGKALIKQWICFIRQSGARAHVIFLSDYDMSLTEHLVAGVDVWLNTPMRPWEACGTSGMKVLVNGGLNLSERDGWWAEAYTPEVGWALGDGQEHGSDPAWDAAEASQLYALLENEIIPGFYTRDENGIPRAWVNKIRESMAQLTPRFSAARAVQDYTDQNYLPAAQNYLARAANQSETGMRLVAWEQSLRENWAKLHFGEITVELQGGEQIFEVPLYLGDLDPNAVQVQLYADGIGGDPPVLQEMVFARALAAGRGNVYRKVLSPARPAKDYTARVIPRFRDAAVPLETARILWQH